MNHLKKAQQRSKVLPGNLFECSKWTRFNNNGFPKKHPGTIHNARWITTASTVMRLYIQTRNPPKELTRLVVMILNIYGPTFVNIKRKPHIKYASHHYFFALHQGRQHLTKEERDVVESSFKINSFSAHPEVILLGALFDPDKNTRRTAVDIIIKDREKRKIGSFRQYIRPTKYLNFNAKSYLELVDLSTIPNSFLTEPPLTFNIKNEEFLKCIEGDLLDIPDIPCHSQNVERFVASTTKEAKKTPDERTRHQRLVTIHHSRSKISKDFQKSDFIAFENDE
ncbi:Uncharacterized protein FKW44_019910 [Caligus rogercresseyi]|uniref:Uncharacterized protein n=1 Tax=Caligus rogercresseyi TaxID=217165 RepID=A0A7T8GWG8_CALRO|nr:Uncharacterized protein FKW44_019910 [Caligus rogercresseyi]